MEQSTYGLSVTLPVTFDVALTRATAALKAEGFGVLTSIDVQQTLKAKLNRDFRKYVILGACNPVLADRALHTELEIGLLLPCNVVVRADRADESSVIVEAMNPQILVEVTGEPALRDIADEVTRKMQAAIDSLQTAATPA